MSNRILELETELSAAIKIIDDGDRYSNNLEYIDSPYCAVVREFLFKHGVISEEERPKLKLESINEIKKENEQLAKDKAELVEALEGLFCSIDDDLTCCMNERKLQVIGHLLEKHKCD